MDSKAQEKFSTALPLSSINQKMKKRLKKIRKTDVYDEHGDTALHHYVLLGDVAAVAYLIEIGWDVNVTNSHGTTPLTYAILNNRTGIVQLLVNGGAVGDGDQQDGSPLHLAARHGSVGLVKVLLDGGFDVHGTNSSGQTALHCAVLNSDHKVACDIIDVLIEAGADINAVDKFGETALHMRVLHDATSTQPEENYQTIAEIVKKLLSKGANINAVNGIEKTPLAHAASSRNVSASKILIDAGCDVNFRNTGGETALYFAVMSGSRIEKELIKLLLDSGATINVPNISGFSPLDMIVENRAFSAEVRRLSHVEVIFDHDEAIERTLSHEVAQTIELIKLFHEYGADLNSNPRNLSPLYLSLDELNVTHSKIVDTLLSLGAKFNFNDEIVYLAMRAEGKTKTAMAMVRHAAKFHEIHEDDSLFSFDLGYLPNHLQNYYHQCRKELETMKTSCVSHSVSLFDLIKDKVPRFYSKNQVVIEAFASNSISEKFPIYENNLKDHFEKEKELEKLRVKASKGLERIFRLHKNRVSLVFDKILDYLIKEDMCNLSMVE